MNFNVASFFSIYHPLLYITNILIVSRFLQRWFQNHIAGEMILSLNILSNYMCVNLMLFFDGL